MGNITRRGIPSCNQFEGNMHFTFDQYERISKELSTSSPENTNEKWDGLLFGWCYFVLQWNLMARASNVAHLMFNHFSWEGDSMTITLPKTKGDPEGLKVFPKHVYANPFNPLVCPLLALAIHLFCLPFRHPNS